MWCSCQTMSGRYFIIYSLVLVNAFCQPRRCESTVDSCCTWSNQGRHHATLLMHGKQRNARMSHPRVTRYFRLTGYLPRPAMRRESRQQLMMRRGGHVVAKISQQSTIFKVSLYERYCTVYFNVYSE